MMTFDLTLQYMNKSLNNLQGLSEYPASDSIRYSIENFKFALRLNIRYSPEYFKFALRLKIRYAGNRIYGQILRND